MYLTTVRYEKRSRSDMRTVHTDRIKEAVKEMCIEANLTLSPDVESRKAISPFSPGSTDSGTVILAVYLRISPTLKSLNRHGAV